MIQETFQISADPMLPAKYCRYNLVTAIQIQNFGRANYLYSKKEIKRWYSSKKLATVLSTNAKCTLCNLFTLQSRHVVAQSPKTYRVAAAFQLEFLRKRRPQLVNYGIETLDPVVALR